MNSLGVWFSITLIIQIAQGQKSQAQSQDSSKVSRWARCYPLHEDSYVGIDFGTLQHRPGLKLYDYMPWLLGMRTYLATDVSWRPPISGENYLNLELTKHRVFYSWCVDPAFTFGYKKIGSNDVNLEQFWFLPGYFDWHYGVMLGYAVERRHNGEDERHHGIAFRIYKEFLNRLTVNATMIHWVDKIQHSIAIQKNFYQSPFSMVIGWERIRKWNELNISILYRYR